jgi:hypothetical protein
MSYSLAEIMYPYARRKNAMSRPAECLVGCPKNDDHKDLKKAQRIYSRMSPNDSPGADTSYSLSDAPPREDKGTAREAAFEHPLPDQAKNTKSQNDFADP